MRGIDKNIKTSIMKKYTPRAIIYLSTPVIAFAFSSISPTAITAPLIDVWFASLTLTIYIICNKINTNKMFFSQTIKIHPKNISIFIIFAGFIGASFATISNSSPLAHLSFVFIFLALEGLLRLHEQKFDACRKSES